MAKVDEAGEVDVEVGEEGGIDRVLVLVVVLEVVVVAVDLDGIEVDTDEKEVASYGEDLNTSGKVTIAAASTAPCQVKIRLMPKC